MLSSSTAYTNGTRRAVSFTGHTMTLTASMNPAGSSTMARPISRAAGTSQEAGAEWRRIITACT